MERQSIEETERSADEEGGNHVLAQLGFLRLFFAFPFIPLLFGNP